VIHVRKLTCFCQSCRDLKYNNCANTAHVDSWKEESVTLGARRHKRKQKTPTRSCSHEESAKPPSHSDVSFVGLKKNMHGPSLSLIPPDHKAMYPVNVFGDGNCLPRCGSLIAYGIEGRHPEIRAHIVKELHENLEYYLDKDSFLPGKHPEGHNNAPSQFAQYSDQLSSTHDTRDPKCVADILLREVENVKKMGSYMGAWQVAALATVLQRPVISVYPEYGGYTVRKDVHRTFFPRCGTANLQAVRVMWTHMQGKAGAPANQWSPNHFVLLLPIKSGDDGDDDDLVLTDVNMASVDVDDDAVLFDDVDVSEEGDLGATVARVLEDFHLVSVLTLIVQLLFE
jgi:hypothetical protein